MRFPTFGAAVVRVGTALAVAGAAHAFWNLHRYRRPPLAPPWVAERVAILLPVRNEAARVQPCLSSVLTQTRVRDLRIVVLDDGSTDATRDLVQRIAGDDPRVSLRRGADLPAGWWGKPWACQQLADAVTGVDSPTVLVFVDADVQLAPTAVASAVTMLRWAGLDLVSPYPRQVAVSAVERLVQPLLQWSFLTMLPLRVAERSPRPSLAAANGQFLVVDAAAYRRAGGHAAVRADMLEDVALLRAVKRSGGRGGVVDGTRLASCRMYDGAAVLRAGYAKSLWSAFGGPGRTAGVVAALTTAYVVPPAAALRGSRVGLVGYAASVAGRAAVAHRVGARSWPDAAAHPASIALFAGLVTDSVLRRHRGTVTVSGRPLSVARRVADMAPRPDPERENRTRPR